MCLIATVISIESLKRNLFYEFEKSNIKMGLYQQFQTAITFANTNPFIQIQHISAEWSCKARVKKDFVRTILFRSYQCETLYIILCILLNLITFMIYQNVNSFPALSTKFCESFLYNSEYNNVSSVIFNVYFDL